MRTNYLLIIQVAPPYNNAKLITLEFFKDQQMISGVEMLGARVPAGTQLLSRELDISS